MSVSPQNGRAFLLEGGAAAAAIVAAVVLGLTLGLLWMVGITPYFAAVMLSLLAALSVRAIQFKHLADKNKAAAEMATQEALKSEAKAVEANRDKSKFLGMLSHELLTPLQAVVSSMDMIESKGSVSRSDQVFLRLREGTRALHARTSDLVDFAKMSGGRLTISQRKFRVDRLIEDVIAEHEESVISKDLDVHWDAHPTLAQPIVSDPRRVRQILDNLISNAIKYTQRGSLMIDASINTQAQQLRFEVRDTGIGIAPEALAHIFEPFYRVANASQFAQGSGLGLAVVHSLVDLLEGEIQVESVLGQGSVFSVTIAFSVQKSVQAHVSVPSLNHEGQVLIVDDEHDVRAVIADLVRTLGHQPIEAGSASEALRVLAEEKFAMVFLDIELAEKSGFDVIRDVREGNSLNRDSYFVMMSASNAHHEAVALFNARADKPVDIHQLRALLQRAH
jgi:signal transduction histidine kinase